MDRSLVECAVILSVLVGCSDSLPERSVLAREVAELAEQELSFDAIHCRQARIAVRRLPVLGWIWTGFGATTDEARAVDVAARRLEEALCTSGTSRIDRRRAARGVEAAVGRIAVRFADWASLTHGEAVEIVSGTLVRFQQQLRTECGIDANPDAFLVPDPEFDERLSQFTFGTCLAGAAAAGAVGPGPAPAGPPTSAWAGGIRQCFAEHADEARPRDDCGGRRPVAGDDEAPPEPPDDDNPPPEPPDGDDPPPDPGDETPPEEPEQTIDDEGNGHTQIENDDGFTSYECDGSCEFDENGRPINWLERNKWTETDTGLIVERWKRSPDGTVGLDQIKGWGKWGERETSTDAEGDDFDYNCLLDDSMCSPSPQCMVMSAYPGVDVAYLVSSPTGDVQHGLDPSGRLPVTGVEIFMSCVCESSSAPGMGPLGIFGANSACLSEEDQERLDCLRMPFGPADAPRCRELAEVDMAALAEQFGDLQCSLMQCPEGTIRAVVRRAGSAGCACVSHQFLDGFFEGRGRPACLRMTCLDGPCVCDDHGCRCHEGGWGAVAPFVEDPFAEPFQDPLIDDPFDPLGRRESDSHMR